MQEYSGVSLVLSTAHITKSLTSLQAAWFEAFVGFTDTVKCRVHDETKPLWVFLDRTGLIGGVSGSSAECAGAVT
jgi:hypothetical protein